MNAECEEDRRQRRVLFELSIEQQGEFDALALDYVRAHANGETGENSEDQRERFRRLEIALHEIEKTRALLRAMGVIAPDLIEHGDFIAHLLPGIGAVSEPPADCRSN